MVGRHARKEGSDVRSTTGGATRSDALVVFGVTGDLAHKMIFPALYAMAKRGDLTAQSIAFCSYTWPISD